MLSTLHTNDAPSSFTRLVDMGAEPFLVASSLRGVLAQRLVRQVCENCAEEEEISVSALRMLGLPEDDFFPIRRGKGCEVCGMKGYKGRSGIFELLMLDERLAEMVAERQNTDRIKSFALENHGFQTLRQDGIAKIRRGLTTPEEVIRVTMA